MAGKHVSLLVHFIWSTAGREPWIGNEWREQLHAYVGGVIRNKNGKLLAAGGMHDHVHLYASLPSTISLAEFVNAVKSNSSRWIHETLPNRRAFAWQEGYGAFSVSKSQERMVIEYIHQQERHHCKRTFKDEFVEFLTQYQVTYDERYLWD
ncbi:MAG TPA: IS200/IS605 family transposase [Pyrinomonadaceae bacterium]|nr:IS200/IS605 family transposase [Pyrinomonadaceae bacterium]